MVANRSRGAGEAATRQMLRHWQEAVPNDRLAHLVKHAARGLARALQMRLTEHSVSYGHWTFLRILWEAEGLTQRQLSDEAGVMEPTTFSALNAMEKLGYVARRPSPTNRKEVHGYLTPKGRALKTKLVPLAEEVNAVALRRVDPGDIAATRRTLLALIANLAADETESLALRRRIPSTRELSRLLGGSRARARKALPRRPAQAARCLPHPDPLADAERERTGAAGVCAASAAISSAQDALASSAITASMMRSRTRWERWGAVSALNFLITVSASSWPREKPGG